MPNNDLISRKAFLDEISRDIDFEREYNAPPTAIGAFKIAINRAKRLPTVDAVEVVRCKDCKFSEPFESIPSYRYCIALKDVINFGDDFYCARGAKMEKPT